MTELVVIPLAFKMSLMMAIKHYFQYTNHDKLIKEYYSLSIKDKADIWIMLKKVGYDLVPLYEPPTSPLPPALIHKIKNVDPPDDESIHAYADKMSHGYSVGDLHPTAIAKIL